MATNTGLTLEMVEEMDQNDRVDMYISIMKKNLGALWDHDLELICTKYGHLLERCPDLSTVPDIERRERYREYAKSLITRLEKEVVDYLAEGLSGAPARQPMH